MQTQYGYNLYQDLMNLVNEDESPFYYVDHLFNGVQFRIFTYRLASYTDFLKPSALECRGHAFSIDNNGKYVELAALPMNKFFNFGENPLAMDIDFSKTNLIMDKMDGSLMTTYKLPIADMVMLKSKTSFTSDQANDANAWLQLFENVTLHNYLMYMMHAGYSVSLEFTSPSNRIVLGYQEPRLTVLCARDLNNGHYVSYDVLLKDMEEFRCEQYLVKDHSKTISPDQLQNFIDNIQHMKDIEGYVIFADGKFTKHKTTQYCILHKSKSSVDSPKALFETVVNESHDDLIAMFPGDEYLINRINETIEKVKKIYKDIENNADAFFKENSTLSRKDYAILAREKVNPLYFGLTMNAYLGKDYNIQDWIIKHYKDFNISDDCASMD